MNYELIGFGITISVYVLLTFLKLLEQFYNKLSSDKNSNNQRNVLYNHLDPEAKRAAEKKAASYAKKKFIKQLINYSVSFNSAFLVVGSMSEAYFYGVRMVGNILSVSLGYVYAFAFVQPFMHSLDDDIKTPYQYFGKRYRNNIYVTAISAAAGMLFYFSFLTLYLYGCAILLTTLIPEVSIWMSSTIIGSYSVLGSLLGGFTQSTKTNLAQFFILLLGLFFCTFYSIFKSNEHSSSLSKLWSLAQKNKRTVFIDTHVDLSTRYTILNQTTSLSIPWTAMHALLLPSFIRYRSIKHRLKSRIFIISSFPFMVLVNLLNLIPGGILIYTFFYGCNPLFTRKIVNRNQIATYWMYLVLSENRPALCGIMFASIIAYSIIQHSSGMPLLANEIYEDILGPMFFSNRDISLFVKKKIILGLTLLFGVVSILYSISFQHVKNTMISLFFIFNNSIHSPIMGLFTLSAFNPYANGFGAMLSFCSNLCINFFLASGDIYFRKLKPQEFQLETSNCEASFHTNITSLNPHNLTYPLHHYTNANYQSTPPNALLTYLFSIAPIWYCLFSLLYMLVFGSLFSFMYSWITTHSWDVDAEFRQERRKYLYLHRMF